MAIVRSRRLGESCSPPDPRQDDQPGTLFRTGQERRVVHEWIGNAQIKYERHEKSRNFEVRFEEGGLAARETQGSGKGE